jgi:hypothetical protein
MIVSSVAGSASGDVGGAVSVVNTDAGTNPFFIHGWLLWGMWGVLGFLQVVSMRYMKNHWVFNALFHIISGWCILIIGLAMSLYAIRKMDGEIDVASHNTSGMIVFIMAFILVITGILARYAV